MARSLTLRWFVKSRSTLFGNVSGGYPYRTTLRHCSVGSTSTRPGLGPASPGAPNPPAAPGACPAPHDRRCSPLVLGGVDCEVRRTTGFVGSPRSSVGRLALRSVSAATRSRSEAGAANRSRPRVLDPGDRVLLRDLDDLDVPSRPLVPWEPLWGPPCIAASVSYASYRFCGVLRSRVPPSDVLIGWGKAGGSVDDAVGPDPGRREPPPPSCAEASPSERPSGADAAAVTARALVPAGAARVSSLSSSDGRGDRSSSSSATATASFVRGAVALGSPLVVVAAPRADPSPRARRLPACCSLLRLSSSATFGDFMMSATTPDTRGTDGPVSDGTSGGFGGARRDCGHVSRAFSQTSGASKGSVRGDARAHLKGPSP